MTESFSVILKHRDAYRFEGISTVSRSVLEGIPIETTIIDGKEKRLN